MPIRAVTADHFMFQEAIEYFRPGAGASGPEKILLSYLLFNFQLKEKINTEYFTIENLADINLISPYQAHVAKIEFKSYDAHTFNCHLYALAVSSILSFILERPVKSARNDYNLGKSIKEKDIPELGIHFPVLGAGPGSALPLSSGKLRQLHHELPEITQKLHTIEYKKYEIIMQTFRLIQLAHINFKDDFGLAFSLLVAAIETTAQMAIKVEDIQEDDLNEEKWKVRAEKDEEYSELFSAFQDLKSKSRLKERFVEFVFKYCPPEDWENMEHPHAFLLDLKNSLKFATEKRWYEKYPKDIPEDYLREIVGDTYKYRSRFVHAGKQPPHGNSISTNKFFEEQTFFTNGYKEAHTVFLINYNLLSYIAHQSIRNYILEIPREEKLSS